jgi:hypothetical protein
MSFPIALVGPFKEKVKEEREREEDGEEGREERSRKRAPPFPFSMHSL